MLGNLVAYGFWQAAGEHCYEVLGVCMVGPDAAEIMQVTIISIPVLVSLPVVLIVLSCVMQICG